MAERLVLVTGATGAVGPSVVRAFESAGYRVRTLSLRQPPAGLLPRDVDTRAGDVCDAQTVSSAVAGVDVVVHLAALLHQFDASPAIERAHERINLGGTQTVTRAAAAAGVRRLIFLSTIAVYGRVQVPMIDERIAPAPDTPYGRTKLAAEQVVLAAETSGTPIGTVLRAAATYGTRVKGNYRRLAMAIGTRRFIQLGSGLNRRTLVHDRDLASAIVLSADHPAAAGATFNVTDGQVHTLAEIVEAIHSAIGRHPPRFRVPMSLARAAAGLCEPAFRLIGRRPPVTRELLDKYSEDVAVDGTLIQRTLGFAPAIDLQTGWRETMGALRSEW